MEVDKIIRQLHRQGKSVSQIDVYLKSKNFSFTGVQIRAIIKGNYKAQKIKSVELLRKGDYGVQKKFIKDTYKESESRNPEKEKINKLIAQYVEKLNLLGTPMVLLESPALATTKELIRVGVRKYNIFIPNYTDSFIQIKSKHPTQNVFPITFGEFITKMSNKKYGVVFADYCGTLDGSKLFSPIKDLQLLFRHKKFYDTALLGVTISQRNSKKPNKYINNDISRLNNIVGQSAIDNGYIAIDLGEGRSYNRGRVYFALYIIRKR